MKLCNICKQPMDADVAFAKLHNICRNCLESGQDTECLNNPRIELSEWEQQHIRRCTKCAKRFIATWHLGMQCSICAKPIRERQRIKELTLQLKHICSEVKLMRDKYIKCRLYINNKMRLMRLAKQIDSSSRLLKNKHRAKKRIEQFFGTIPPFDAEILCQIMARKKAQYNDLSEDDIYDVLHQFFVDGYSQALIANMHNLSVSSMMCLIYRCRYIIARQKYNWLFQPVQSRPKVVKVQELNKRIADIIKSQSRIDLTGTKE